METGICSEKSHLIDLSPLTRQFGILFPTWITHEFLVCHGQAPEIVSDQPTWLWDVVWTARRALTGLMPCRRESTEFAELYHFELYSFVPGCPEPAFIRCVVVLAGDAAGNPHLTFHLDSPV
jgi:hypothetical protein